MSGYAGNSDLEAEHAMILSENGVHASKLALQGPIVDECVDCGNDINPARVAFARKMGMTCTRCIECQEEFDKLPKQKVKMLDRIL